MRQNGFIRRLALLLVVCLIALIPAAGAGAQKGHSHSRAAAAPAGLKIKNGKTQPKFSYAKAVRETIYIESDIDDDGKPGPDLLATDIIRPKETNGSLKVSTIYEMSPYYQNIHGSGAVQLGRGNEHEVKEEEDGDYVPQVFPLYYDNYFVPRGYAVMLQDAPGTRNSEGCMVLGGNGELAAAKATMAWLNGNGTAYRLDETTGLPGEEVEASWSNGKAGMIGKSYDATIANAAASIGIKGLKTIVPIGGISRWYNYMFHNGVQYTGNAATSALFTYYIDQPPADDEEAVGKWVTATFGENSVCEAKGTAISGEAANATGDYTTFWDERDYMRDPADLGSIQYSSKVPNMKKKTSIFIGHGMNDYNVKPSNWNELWNLAKKYKLPRKMWLSQTGHVDPFDFRRGKWVKTLHRWFDTWLYGLNNGIKKEKAVDIERGPDKWKSYGTWPAKRGRKLRLWLGPAKKDRIGTLTRKRPAAGATQTYLDDGPSESTMTSDPKTVKENRLLFTTRKLKRNVRLSGGFPLKLSAAVDKPDTNFTLLLVDYGTTLRVNHLDSGEGIRTLEQESCHGASTDLDDACYFKTEKTSAAVAIEIVSHGWLDAKHRPRKSATGPGPYKNLRSSEPLTPGENYKFKWSAFGEDYVFKKGHRIGVVISGSDSTFTVPDPDQANVTVNLRGSRVSLPVVGKTGRKVLKRATK